MSQEAQLSARGAHGSRGLRLKTLGAGVTGVSGRHHLSSSEQRGRINRAETLLWPSASRAVSICTILGIN